MATTGAAVVVTVEGAGAAIGSTRVYGPCCAPAQAAKLSYAAPLQRALLHWLDASVAPATVGILDDHA